ncbi:MFS transporter [Saccharothrix syringae]|uniref:MFS transporter n=1 Tax=Saccharothrix syringae TaxID=103733 RepID=A0A5Q0H9Y8_SACSY|nr:MFS transporter [Saccharothrix syringae]QFZ23056.1 MFS transporter [Saccharothrix syringae]
MKLDQRDFARFWAADTVSLAGTHVTTLALKAVAVLTLGASTTVAGLLESARWLPYLLLGLVAGVLVDRRRRLPLLIGTDFARAAVLALVPLLAFTGLLTIPLLAAIVLVFGTLSLFHDAAHQSFLPRLVTRQQLTDANARMEQTRSAAQGVGPLVGGALVKLIGGPLAFLVDAVSYLISGLVLSGLRTPEPPPTPEERHLRTEIRDGLRWVYHHPVLRPMALATHAWFFFSSMVSATYTVLVLDELHFDPFEFGVTFAVGGAGALLGASLAGRACRRFGEGQVILVGRWLTPAAYALLPFATATTSGFALLCAAQFAFYFAIGLESPGEMGYRQAVTPDRLQGRMNGTMRSINRAAIVFGAPLGGVLADTLGFTTALWIAIAGLTVQAVGITCSSVRTARV